MSHTVVVIGGGPAGTFAALAAKRQSPETHVVLLTDERCEPYEKPPLSKAVLLGTARPEDARIAGPQGVAAHDVVLNLGSSCVAIDRDAQNVVLGNGRHLSYDALVIATGAVARQIPHVPPGMPHVHYLRTQADAYALKTALHSSRTLLVIGGGLIGLEVAACAAELGVKTTVLEVALRLMPRVCDELAAELMHTVHRQHNVDIRLGTTVVAAWSRTDCGVVVETDDGEKLDADLVVVGTGAKPNDGLAAAAGLTTNDGVVVDERCQTSAATIFAAGDVVRFPGLDGLVRLENWRHALDQGTIAGRNAAGANQTYAAVPSFWSEQYDLYIQGVGWRQPGAQSVRRALQGRSSIVFEICHGRLVYAMGINAQRDMAAARRLIERRGSVDADALADPAQPLAGMLKR